MKVFGIILFVALAGFVAAGPPRIPNHPVCVAIMNSYYHSFPDADDCKCFYKCDWADAVRFCCPRDNQTPNEDGYLVFNPALQVCDRKPAAEAAGAVCGGGGGGVTTPSTPKPPPGCSSTTPEPSSTTPSSTTSNTTTPTSTTPSTTTTPTSTTPSTTKPPSDGCSYLVHTCPENNAYYHSFIHETCDDKWCQCDWGKAIIQPCPTGLIFNDVIQVCDWPKPGVTYNMCG